MAGIHSFCIALFLISTAAARRLDHKHNDLAKRQVTPTPAAVSASTTSQVTYTTIYPYPGASPIPVTSQGQVVSSYVPQFTLCELPPLAFFTPSALPTLSASSGSLSFVNYSISTASGNGTCTTLYEPTITMVCATVLSDLTTTYTVSQCNQDVTFSTEYGYSLIIPTPTPVILSSGTVALNSTSYITPPPSIQTLRTYFIAPWQYLTTAGPPSDVDYKICKEYDDGTEACVLEYYKWKTSLLTLSSLTTTAINITTTIPGPSQLIIETLVANVTATATVISFNTTLELETSTLFETTYTSSKTTSTSTNYQTKTVEYASSRSTTTIHVQVTSTTTVGTTTITLTTATPTALPSASLLSTLLPSASLPSDDTAASSTDLQGETRAVSSANLQGETPAVSSANLQGETPAASSTDLPGETPAVTSANLQGETPMANLQGAIFAASSTDSGD